MKNLLFISICGLALACMPAQDACASDGNLYTVVRPGVNAGTGTADYYVDIFAPLDQSEEYVFFAEPRFRINPGRSDEYEFNLGLGYRRLLSGGGWYAGANVFYDTMESPNDFRYHQIGLGVEARSMWIDVIANGYIQAGDTKNRLPANDRYSLGSTMLVKADGYEEALSGMDGEIGFLVPGISDIVETRLYAGGYWWLSGMSDDISGVRARLQIDPVPFITVNGSYSYDDTRESVWRADAYLNIPFEVSNIFDGRCPLERVRDSFSFGSGPRDPQGRMADRVERDRYVQTEEALTGYEGVHDMIYVDNSNVTGTEDGSLDHPYSTITDAVQRMLGDGPEGIADPLFDPSDCAWIYVFRGVGDYYEGDIGLFGPNLDPAKRSVTVWGEHFALPGMTPGGFPVVDVHDLDYGFTYNGGTEGGTLVFRGMRVTGAYNDGLRADHLNTVFLNDNEFVYNNCDGVDLRFVGANINVFGNRFIDNVDQGLSIRNYAVEGYMAPPGIGIDVHDNVISGNDSYGLKVQIDHSAEEQGLIDINIHDNISSDNLCTEEYVDIVRAEGGDTCDGIYVEINRSDGGDTNVSIRNNTCNANTFDGIRLNVTDLSLSGFVSAEVAGNRANGNLDDGIEVNISIGLDEGQTLAERLGLSMEGNTTENNSDQNTTVNVDSP